MIPLVDKFGKKFRVRFEKKRKEISIYLYDGREKYFVSVIDIYKERKTAEIQEFILKHGFDTYVRRGLGTKIVKLLETELKSYGVVTIIGDVVESDKGAENFWEKQGYEITPCNIGPVIFTIKKEI